MPGGEASDTAGYVVLRDIVKRYGRVEAVRRVDLDVRRDEFVTLLGPSGCGKTTVLRIMAGLEVPDSGTCLIDGRSPTKTPTRARRTRMVFQQYALFPHLTVRDNVGYGLRMRGDDRATIRTKVERMLGRMGLSDKGERKPRQLSGGEQQRVALARALVTEPTVLLLDEPLGALDRQLRSRMQLELKELQKQLAITFIYVTHDQEEALTMSDRIVVMNRGRISQVGIAEDIYLRPRTRFVAEFIGVANCLVGRVESRDGIRATLDFGGSKIGGADPDGLVTVGDEAVAVIRPEHVRIADASAAPGGLHGTVASRSFLGAATRYIVDIGGGRQVMSDSGETRFAPGDAVSLDWPAESTVILHADDEREAAAAA
jgi:ABC-type Fe3+/spermidine/putrescine transport system ATPase subunit